MSRSAVSLSVAVALLAVPATLASPTRSAPELRLHRDLPRDPMILVATLIEDPQQFARSAATWAEQLDAGELAEGLASLAPEVLRWIGPELVIFVDLPPLDQTVAASADGQLMQRMLARTGVVSRVPDTAALEQALARAFARSGWQTELHDRVRHVSVPDGDSRLDVYYATVEGRLAIGFSESWVRKALGPGANGDRLVDGADYQTVFTHLEGEASDLTYVNLPRLRRWVAESRFAEIALGASPDAGDLVRALLTDEVMGVGLGTLSSPAGSGVRTTTYGPSWMSGAAISSGLVAMFTTPNLLTSPDETRSRHTVSDLESIATACEGFSADARTYPGPTDGWVPVDKIAVFLEPVYIGSLPRTDAWQRPILYWSDGSSYRLMSTGRDGQMDEDWTVVREPVASAAMDGDIVMVDGDLMVVPAQLVAE